MRFFELSQKAHYRWAVAIVGGCVIKAVIELVDGDRGEALSTLLVAAIFCRIAMADRKALAAETSARATLSGQRAPNSPS